MRRVAITVRGVVQGVGFRPFVYRLALEESLSGFVQNRTDGVVIEVQGSPAQVERFLARLRSDAPPQAQIEDVRHEERPPRHDEASFQIAPSDASAKIRPSVPADLALCPECAAEIADPTQRRFGYPFTNCTNCGPRYSLIESLPYDRPRTSMKGFAFCPDCEREYRDPLDRRFHAQPVACPACGPQLALLDAEGSPLALRHEALAGAIQALREGRIVALKGLGGFQLLVDACRPDAVQRLRERKRREAKPFAVMFPDLPTLHRHAPLDSAETRALTSPQAPIVLVRRDPRSTLAPQVAPENPRVGAMLPYTPLHALLSSRFGRPLICTSGNLSDEPMCIETSEALSRLRSIADVFLVHDRPIVRPVDDSVVRVDSGRITLLRRARGFAPLPLPFPEGTVPVLALGAHLKNTVALTVGDQVVLSQHLGDLDSAEGAALQERTVEDLTRFFEVTPGAVACDLHPDYASTRLAERLAARWKIPLVRVQHHHAHVAAILAEHRLTGEVLGLAWDGTGLGDDGTVWGGEALVCEGDVYRRVHPLRPFPLPGGDLAAREPRRVALGLLFTLLGEKARPHVEGWFRPQELDLLFAALGRGLHAPPCTSIGRLFDGVAALCGLHPRAQFEGQAAMALEAAAGDQSAVDGYRLPVAPDGRVDWEPLIRAVVADLADGAAPAKVSARFHLGLATLAVNLARRSGLSRVVLGGGCFQNERLTRLTSGLLEDAGFKVFRAERVPPNDGAIALGQALVAARQLAATSRHP